MQKIEDWAKVGPQADSCTTMDIHRKQFICILTRWALSLHDEVTRPGTTSRRAPEAANSLPTMSGDDWISRLSAEKHARWLAVRAPNLTPLVSALRVASTEDVESETFDFRSRD